MVKGPVKRTYRALVDGWIAGRRVAVGDEIEMTAAAAKYEAVELVADAKSKEPARAAGKGASKRRDGGAAE